MDEIEISSTPHDSVNNSEAMSEGLFDESNAIVSGCLILEVTIAFVGLLGNLLVCFVISRQRKSRTGLKLFIRNLALADIGVLTILFPIAVVEERMPLQWPFGKIVCLYVLPSAEVFHGVSIWSITAIAIERYRKITTHTEVHTSTSSSSKAFKWGLFFVWVVSFLIISLPLLFAMELVQVDSIVYCDVTWSAKHLRIYILSSSILWYILPLGIIIFTYVQISRQLQQSNKFHRSSISQRSRGERKLEDSVIHYSEEKKRMRQNSKAKKILTPIVLVFALSMLPFNVVRVLRTFWEDVVTKKYFGVIYHVCVIGILINSASDPVIYSVVAKDFRVELKAVWLRFAQRLRDLVNIKATDGNPTFFKFGGVCYRKRRESQFSAEQDRSVVETPQTLLSSPV